MQKISPFLWFDGQAEAAANFYVSVFKNSRILRTIRYGHEGHEIHGQAAGSVMTVDFEIEGQQFTALNGGPVFQLNEAVSFVVHCDSQEEVDYYWERLADGGDQRAQQCGWLKDRFGVSWQIVPTILLELLSGPDREKSERVMKALLQMKKLDIQVLIQAAEGR